MTSMSLVCRLAAALALAVCVPVLGLLLATSDACAAAKGIEDNRLERAALDPDADDIVAEISGSSGLGATWTKLAIEWNKLQPDPPPAGYNEAYFATLETIIAKFHAAGVKVILTPHWVPKWASDQTLWNSPPGGYAEGYQPMYAPTATGIAAYGELGAELARRFARYDVEYECWNEPNLYYFLYPQVRPGQPRFGPSTYLKLLKAYYKGVRSEDADGVVIAGANSPRASNNAMGTSPQRFAGYLKDNGAADYFDVYSHHPYQTGGSRSYAPDQPSYNTRTAVTLYNLKVLQRMFPKKPFYITEYAYSTYDTKVGLVGISEVLQATYMRKAFAMVKKQRQIKVLIWYLVRDSGPYVKPTKLGPTYLYTGVRRHSGQRKASWYAFAGGNRLTMKGPSSVKAGRMFEIKGALSNREGALAGMKLRLQSRTSAKAAWKKLKTATTAAGGTYSFRFLRQRTTRYYRVQWSGVAQTASRRIRVR